MMTVYGYGKGGRMTLLFYRLAERFWRGAERFAGKMAERSARCSECGGNRYTAKSCVGQRKQEDEWQSH
jgi:hypothetical protein